MAIKDVKPETVPRCSPNTRKMNFYYISSIEELSIQSFGVLEPESNLKNLYNTADHSICFVPALCFDENGYRLGYGMGYYDRFLMGYSGLTIGLCYSECVRGHLQHGKFDRPVDIVITEKFIKRTSLNRR